MRTDDGTGTPSHSRRRDGPWACGLAAPSNAPTGTRTSGRGRCCTQRRRRSRSLHGDAIGEIELPVPVALAAPLGEEGSRVRELLDAVADLLGDEDVPNVVDPAHRANLNGRQATSATMTVDPTRTPSRTLGSFHVALRPQVAPPRASFPASCGHPMAQSVATLPASGEGNGSRLVGRLWGG
jgi:hypothetical protein